MGQLTMQVSHCFPVRSAVQDGRYSESYVATINTDNECLSVCVHKSLVEDEVLTFWG